MNELDQMHELLTALELALLEAGWWGNESPDAAALASTEPFCVDTLRFSEWLQWVYIPKMRAYIASQGALPERSGLLVIAEEAWRGSAADTDSLLLVMRPRRPRQSGRRHAAAFAGNPPPLSAALKKNATVVAFFLGCCRVYIHFERSGVCKRQTDATASFPAGIYRRRNIGRADVAVDAAGAETLRQDEAQLAAACFFIELHFVADGICADVCRHGRGQGKGGEQGGGAVSIGSADAPQAGSEAAGDNAADGDAFAVFPALVGGERFEGVAEGVAEVE